MSVARRARTCYHAADMISSVSLRSPFPTTPRLTLPEDEGSHTGEKMEWWYVNGHLHDDQGRDYGFMSALFDVPDIIEGRYNRHIPYMPGVVQLDTAITQETEGRHDQRRITDFQAPHSQPHPGLTPGALAHQYKEGRGLWRVERLDDETMHVSGPHGPGQLDLTLKQTKPALLMGGEGEIPMGPYGSSKYYTWSRLEAKGTVQIDGETRPVEGTAWMDHQWGDMQIFNGYDGWDWFGIQLNDGSDINAFRFRGPDGQNVQASVGLSNADGSQAISEELQVTPKRYWTSPHTGIRYPTSWHVVIPDRKVDLDVTPTVDDQEMKGTPPHSYPKLTPIPTYWEGSMYVTGTVDGKPVQGKAYGEFTGYGARESVELDEATIELARRKAQEATAS